MSDPEVNADAALQRFLTITQIPGRSGEEADVAARIIELLQAAGLKDSQFTFDGAQSRTRLGGNCGNLIVSLPDNGIGTRTLLSAHMDTVPICVGSKPLVDGDEVRSSAPTGLGADDRGGCGAIKTAIIERLRRGDGNFPPAVVTFLIQEEIGLEGARVLDVAKVGNVDRAFNFDGGTIEKITIGAIGGERITNPSDCPMIIRRLPLPKPPSAISAVNPTRRYPTVDWMPTGLPDTESMPSHLAAANAISTPRTNAWSSRTTLTPAK